MLIGVNAMQVRAAKSGVGQYIHALLGSAVNLAPEDKFLIYCNQANELNYRFDSPNSSTKVWGIGKAPRPVRLLYEYALLPGELKKDNLDVFHGASNFLPVRKICPYVVSIHDLSYYVQPERCPPVRRTYWYAMTRRTVKVADLIITISENSRKDIIHYFPETESRIRMIPIAAHSRFRKIDEPRTSSPQMKRFDDLVGGRPYILYLGTLEPGKNVGRIIQSFDSIAANFPDHVLIMAGDKGWLYESVFQALENAKHKDRIFYVGHVSDDEAVHLFNYANLFVFPSLYEGFGMPPLEAMACGCPVITSNRSSLPEVVGDAAIQINPESVEEFATAMARVLGNPGLQQEMSEAGIARAAQFSWDRCAEETMAVYREAVSMR